jgi:hypothetical protein
MKTSHTIRPLCRGLASVLLVGLLALSALPAPGDDGWVDLFDGKSLKGWRNYGSKEVTGKGWIVEEGVLKKVAKERGGDLITERQYDDFVLEWEWRIPAKANSGVKYFVRERGGSAIGHEYQMVDNATMSKPVWLTATFYDVLPTTTNATPRIGDWNQSRLVVRGNHIEHWLNGVKVLEYECGSPEVRAAVARSKFKAAPEFAEKVRGHVLLTDHQDECWFRNIRIKEGK